jgi:hypothetical protein
MTNKLERSTSFNPDFHVPLLTQEETSQVEPVGEPPICSFCRFLRDAVASVCSALASCCCFCCTREQLETDQVAPAAPVDQVIVSVRTGRPQTELTLEEMEELANEAMALKTRLRTLSQDPPAKPIPTEPSEEAKKIKNREKKQAQLEQLADQWFERAQELQESQG